MVLRICNVSNVHHSNGCSRGTYDTNNHTSAGLVSICDLDVTVDNQLKSDKHTAGTVHNVKSMSTEPLSF